MIELLAVTPPPPPPPPLLEDGPIVALTITTEILVGVSSAVITAAVITIASWVGRRTVNAIEGFLAEVRMNTVQLAELKTDNANAHQALFEAVGSLKSGQDEIKADLEAHAGEDAHPQQLAWNQRHEAEHRE